MACWAVSHQAASVSHGVLLSCLHVTVCDGLKEDASHRLIFECFVPEDGTVWKGLGSVMLMEEKCVPGVGVGRSFLSLCLMVADQA